MITKLRMWWLRRKLKPLKEPYSMENAYASGYNDGKRDGLAVAREQATKSLKEVLWQEQETTPPK